MKFTLTMIVVLVAIATIGIGQLTRAYVVPPSSDPERSLVKRSLCNTFGGCGAKRSMQQLAHNGHRFDPSDGTTNLDGRDSEPWSASRRESKLELISEILNDLIDYLKTSEKYKRGKYIFMVPKPTDSAQAPLQLNGLDLEEIQPSSSANKDDWSHRF